MTPTTDAEITSRAVQNPGQTNDTITSISIAHKTMPIMTSVYIRAVLESLTEPSEHT